jgi:hypothetical protein
MQMFSYFQHFSHLSKGAVPAIKLHLPIVLGAFCQTISATSLCSKTALDLRDPYYLCSCEFIWIREKEPLVPSDSCSTVPVVLCGLVPVCGSAIVRTAG